MSTGIKGKMEDAGKKVVDTAKSVGHKIADGAAQAADWVAEKAAYGGEKVCGTAKTTADIREHMDVIAACGNKVGVVDHVEGASIKLTKHDSPDGQHHRIPMNWVARVDEHVHLSKNSSDAKKEWQPA